MRARWRSSSRCSCDSPSVDVKRPSWINRTARPLRRRVAAIVMVGLFVSAGGDPIDSTLRRPFLDSSTETRTGSMMTFSTKLRATDRSRVRILVASLSVRFPRFATSSGVHSTLAFASNPSGCSISRASASHTSFSSSSAGMRSVRSFAAFADVVTVARRPFGRMARNQDISSVVEHLPSQQTWRPCRACLLLAMSIVRELGLHRVPRHAFYAAVMLAIVDPTLVVDLADIDWVGEDLVDLSSRTRIAAQLATGAGDTLE